MAASVSAARWLVAGLGNPGPVYARTRHNLGFVVVDRLAVEAGAAFSPGEFQSAIAPALVEATPVLLVKPLAFMNASGVPVAAWLGRLDLPPERLVVVHDDLDLSLGRLRLSGEAGPGGHRGVASIQAALGTQAFPRIRVGIGRPRGVDGATDWVLGEFDPEEIPAVADAVKRAAGAVRTLIGQGISAAMDRYHARAVPEPGGPEPGEEPGEGR